MIVKKNLLNKSGKKKKIEEECEEGLVWEEWENEKNEEEWEDGLCGGFKF